VKVGLLALQGAVGLHAAAFDALGVPAVEVRTEAELADVDALVVPGGESTTISKLLVSNRLFVPLAERLADGLPTLGTCAGMIVLSAVVLDGRPDQRSFGAIDIDVRRNAFGRQVDSFESDLTVRDVEGGPFPGVFIRAPFVERVGDDVSVLAEVDGHAVACRQGRVLVTAFHPELSREPRSGAPDLRVHELFCDLAG
jgi:pyridoxal 5'-phosphate synthase pdxT subunit